MTGRFAGSIPRASRSRHRADPAASRPPPSASAAPAVPVRVPSAPRRSPPRPPAVPSRAFFSRASRRTTGLLPPWFAPRRVRPVCRSGVRAVRVQWADAQIAHPIPSDFCCVQDNRCAPQSQALCPRCNTTVTLPKQCYSCENTHFIGYPPRGCSAAAGDRAPPRAQWRSARWAAYTSRCRSASRARGWNRSCSETPWARRSCRWSRR